MRSKPFAPRSIIQSIVTLALISLMTSDDFASDTSLAPSADVSLSTVFAEAKPSCPAGEKYSKSKKKCKKDKKSKKKDKKSKKKDSHGCKIGKERWSSSKNKCTKKDKYGCKIGKEKWSKSKKKCKK